MAADSSPVPHRASWPYLRAPLRIYLSVMGPICVLQCFLIATQTPAWIKISAGLVIALTVLGLLRGYARRLLLSPQGATLRGLTRSIAIPWSRVRRTGKYIPGGGLGATEYAYITTHDRLPQGKWEIDADTLQVQWSEGLLDAIEYYRAQSTP